nr:Uncharacterised protein [Streptococcus thermophilus]
MLRRWVRFLPDAAQSRVLPVIDQLSAIRMTVPEFATAATLVYRIISFAFITLIGWGIYLLVYAGKGFMLGRPQANGPD